MITHASITTGTVFIDGVEYAIADSVLDPQPSLGNDKVRSLIADGVLDFAAEEVDRAATLNLNGYDEFDLDIQSASTLTLGTGLSAITDAAARVTLRLLNEASSDVVVTFSGAFQTPAGNTLASVSVAGDSRLDMVFAPVFNDAGTAVALRQVYPTSLVSTGELLVQVAVPVVVEAGKTRSGFCQPGFVGSVVSISVVNSEKPTSAADGCTAGVNIGAGTTVASFDLTAAPATPLTPSACTLSAATTFTATDVIRPYCEAGADVVGGRDLVFLLTLRRTR